VTRPALFLAALLAFTASACTPAMQDAWRAMSPAERDAYVRYVDGGSVDCYQALDRHWPASSRQWARGIVARESGGDPRAQNPRSSAAGCFQLLSIHAHRVPGGWGNRYDADANTLAALDLYREAGTSPWAL
jgi:hypothetical protein